MLIRSAFLAENWYVTITRTHQTQLEILSIDFWFVYTNCSGFSRPSIYSCKYFRIFTHFMFVLFIIISAGKPGVDMCSRSGNIFIVQNLYLTSCNPVVKCCLSIISMSIVDLPPRIDIGNCLFTRKSRFHVDCKMLIINPLRIDIGNCLFMQKHGHLFTWTAKCQSPQDWNNVNLPQIDTKTVLSLITLWALWPTLNSLKYRLFQFNF